MAEKATITGGRLFLLPVVMIVIVLGVSALARCCR